MQPDPHKVTPFAVPCGYAVDDLGFYHINPLINFKNKVESKAAVIRVTGGPLNHANVKSELEHLIPGTWRCNVEETGVNLFKTVFPSKVELKRMVEWGVLHTKFPGTTMRIEECAGGNEVKYIMPKVWVQFTGLPKELRIL